MENDIWYKFLLESWWADFVQKNENFGDDSGHNLKFFLVLKGSFEFIAYEDFDNKFGFLLNKIRNGRIFCLNGFFSQSLNKFNNFWERFEFFLIKLAWWWDVSLEILLNDRIQSIDLGRVCNDLLTFFSDECQGWLFWCGFRHGWINDYEKYKVENTYYNRKYFIYNFLSILIKKIKLNE